VAETPIAIRKRAENAAAEAFDLEATLMAIIRDELHAAAARAPVRRAGFEGVREGAALDPASDGSPGRTG
jgi:hypothetical protein